MHNNYSHGSIAYVHLFAATLHAELPNVSLNFGESATLNCSAPCNTTILWFVNDLLAQETNRQHCTSDGFRTESFAVYTEVNETAVLCAAVSVCLDHINCTCHSRKAYITGRYLHFYIIYNLHIYIKIMSYSYRRRHRTTFNP